MTETRANLQWSRESKLTRKQQRFVDEYLVDLNATQAAIRSGYSRRSARLSGHKNITNPNIEAAIQQAMDERSKRTEITQDAVVQGLAQIAFANITTYISWNDEGVKLVSSNALPEGASTAVAEVSKTTTKDGGAVRFKLHDKLSALEKLGKHLGMFKDKVELTGKDGGAMEVKRDYKADLISKLDTILERRQQADDSQAADGRTS